ncbi:MAG: hypothetical protein J0L64_24455 [Acidobacteria bacterium]|nr:hypothetical protein [Acidobacteriota bacterium]
MRVSIPICGWLLLATGGLLWGQSGYTVGVALADKTVVRGISVPGQPVTWQPPQYNPATQFLDLTGVFTIPFGRSLNDFVVTVNGRGVTVPLGGGVPVAGALQYGFVVSIPLPGATPPPPGWSIYTFGSILSNPDNIAKPIVAELYDGAQSVLRARQLITIVDARGAGADYDLAGGNATVSEGLQLEMTGRGLDNLEAFHVAGLPHPTAADYEAALTAEMRRKALALPTNTAIGAPTAACIPIDSLPAGWKLLPDYALVFAEAEAQYAAYVTASAAGGGLAQVITNQSCVREPVLPGSFEVCAGALRGTGQSMKLQSVSNVDLSLGLDQATPPYSHAQPSLGPIETKVLGKFLGLFIRYSHAPTRSCLVRPRKTITEPTLRTRPSLDAQRTCDAITLNGLGGARSTGALPFTLKEGSEGREHIDIHAGTQPADYFLLNDPKTSTLPGWCGLNAGMELTSRRLVDQFWTYTNQILNSTWSEGYPRTRQAQALEGIFRSWEPGTWGEANLVGTSTGADHQLTFNYSEAKSKNLRDRFFARMDVGGSVQGKALQSYYLFQPSIFPCEHNLCGFNRTENGTQHDVSFQYTTGALNHIVAQLAATSLLTFNWEPTYQQLGVAPPPGVPPTQKAVLDGPTLSNLHAAFAELGANAASIRVTPVFKPFFYINPQPVRPPGWTPGQENLVYSTPYLQVEVQNSQGTWLRGASYLWDLDFQLTPVATDKLTAAWSGGGGPASVGMAVFSNFTGCVGQYYGASPAGCPDAAYGALLSRLQPVLASKLLYLADRFPAPYNYYSGPQRKQFSLVEKYQEDQVIAFYGNLQ